MIRHTYSASIISCPLPAAYAYRLGGLLNEYFPRDQLTGLNFLVDRKNQVRVVLFVEGNEGEAPCLNMSAYPLRFLGDGFSPFAVWYREKGW